MDSCDITHDSVFVVAIFSSSFFYVRFSANVKIFFVSQMRDLVAKMIKLFKVNLNNGV